MRMALATFLLIYVSLSPALGAALDETGFPECWEIEVNPVTKAQYNKEDYGRDVQFVARQFRAIYGDFDLRWMGALSLAKELRSSERAAVTKEYRKAAKKKRPVLDKFLHCYFGCRISQEGQVSDARYAAWYKEHMDINDCDSDSQYDLEDVRATYAGALSHEATFKDKTLCTKLCSDKSNVSYKGQIVEAP